MTDLHHLASRLYGTPLLIARPKLDVILGVMARKLAGQPLAMPTTESAQPRPPALQIVDGIAIVPVLGTLVRRSAYLDAASGLMSYHAIQAMAEDAFADPQVRAVLLEVDSSGGEAGGVFDLALRLRALSKASGKPLWAIADEAALSAAYAIASAAEQLWLTRTAEAGSIGVVAVHVDQSGADAQAGLSYTLLHAGEHKIDGHPHAPLPASVAGDIQADIDRLYDQFVELVAAHRRLDAQSVRATQARIYRGQAALQAGLADRIGTLDDALAALQQRLARRASADRSAPRLSHPKEMTMHDDAHDVLAAEASVDPNAAAAQAAAPDTAALAAQIEQRLRAELAELTEIAAQAKRLGVTVDPAQALTQGIKPDALRRTVLEQAAARDAAADIVAVAPASASPPSVADSPLVKAAKAYGGNQ
ncbi:putative signal peptide peptidase SppA [Tepidimonas thermarum]|uniref:Putative signal peptide peptidase SppA n=1 Tax=Tepidimonas thermarum TaxID=335431 RepID=A0A554WX17_9BURK|nr:S49 family peptidase [Tepidimonas thermarum]TSE28125.1 putative signal peptide peptidase SppA [Tepidimonas thermarum]